MGGASSASPTPVNMTQLLIRAIAGYSIYLVVLILILFGISNRLDWLMGWAFVCLYAATTVAALAAMLSGSRELFWERMRPNLANAKNWDKVLARLMASAGPAAVWIVAALDVAAAAGDQRGGAGDRGGRLQPDAVGIVCQPVLFSDCADSDGTRPYCDLRWAIPVGAASRLCRGDGVHRDDAADLGVGVGVRPGGGAAGGDRPADGARRSNAAGGTGGLPRVRCQDALPADPRRVVSGQESNS